MRIYGARDGIAKAYGARLGAGWDVVGGAGDGDNCNRIWDGLMLGRVQAAVGRLPAHCQAWALYCYTDIGERSDGAERQAQRVGWEQVLVRWLAGEVYGAPPFSSTLALDALDGLTVLLMVLRDARCRERCGRALYSDADMAEAIGLHRSQFVPGRRWGSFVGVASSAVDGLVRDTLGPVAAVVDAINEGREAA